MEQPEFIDVDEDFDDTDSSVALSAPTQDKALWSPQEAASVRRRFLDTCLLWGFAATSSN